MSRGARTAEPLTIFRAEESFAHAADEADPLREFRAAFFMPKRGAAEVVYLCGNSLGLQPRGSRELIEQELDDWARLAVGAHFHGVTPWYSYHEVFRETGAMLVGARPGEVVMMNSLTVNLHLMMVSFFRPTRTRYRILIDSPVFPSDLHAVETHLRTRGLDPRDALVVARPRAGEHHVRTEDVEALLDREGESIALVLFSGVNFFTGQVHDVARLTTAAHAHGCVAGFDLAHAAGNVVLRLHDWNVDFACWCSYKYLNGGPGAIAGCFVHERHGANLDLPRFAGWWGSDPDTRFEMSDESFTPRPGADGWQLSNPPILAMAPLRASLDLFERASMEALRAKSEHLTGYLRWLIGLRPADGIEIITPEGAQGCQLSVLVHHDARARFARLEERGVVCDFREPNVIRLAPVPLYNTFHDVWRVAQLL